MIEDFDQELLHRRRSFLERRARLPSVDHGRRITAPPHRMDDLIEASTNSDRPRGFSWISYGSNLRIGACSNESWLKPTLRPKLREHNDRHSSEPRGGMAMVTHSRQPLESFVVRALKSSLIRTPASIATLAARRQIDGDLHRKRISSRQWPEELTVERVRKLVMDLQRQAQLTDGPNLPPCRCRTTVIEARWGCFWLS